MPHSLDQLLPSLQALGTGAYWLVALFAMLEAIVFAGVLVPGALAVIAAGALAQRGIIDFFDLAWFVAAGTILGSLVSFQLGRVALHGVGRTRGSGSSHVIRAKDLLTRYGGFAMVLGRFLGPLSAFVPFAAAMAGMPARRFLFWCVVSAVPYALLLPALGYVSGGAIATMGAAAPRILVLGLGALALLAALWFVILRARRMLPQVAEIARNVRDGLVSTRLWSRLEARHPVAVRRLTGRLDPTHASGLAATALVLLFAYLLAAWIDSVTDFVGTAAVTQSDLRVANLLYALREPHLITAAAWITALGGRLAVGTLMVLVTATLLVVRQARLSAIFWLVLVGNTATVAVLKTFFARPRSELGYFVETSGSFPSGHAAVVAAVWGMAFYLAWRIRMIGATMALLAAGTLALVVGLSRIYLIEHYLSDVLNGWLVGTLWLVIGIALCEWARRPRPESLPSGRHRTATALAVTALVALPLVATFGPTKALTPPPPVATIGEWPGETESLLGDLRGPVVLRVSAPDAEALTAAMVAAGWIPALRPGPVRLLGALWSDWTDATPAEPVIVPQFLARRPNDLAFAAPVSGDAARTRHVRFWRSGGDAAGPGRTYVASILDEVPVAWLDEDDPDAVAPIPAGAIDDLASVLRAHGIEAASVPGI